MQVLIVGAGYAGLEAALRLSRKDSDISVTLVNPSEEFRERIRDHQWAAGVRPEPRPLRDFLRGTGVKLVVGRVVAVDRIERTAHVILSEPQLGSAGSELHWDYLVLATGSVVDDGVPGVSEHALTLDGSGAQRLSEKLRDLARRGGRVVVVGGGLTGIELVSEVAETYPKLEVEIVSRGRIGDEFSEAAQRAISRRLERLGVRVHPQQRISEVVDKSLLTPGDPIAFDICIWAAGFRAPPLPSGLDLALDSLGRVLVREDLMSVVDPRVFVAGDSAKIISDGGPELPGGCKTAGPAGSRVADNVIRSHQGMSLRPFRPPVPLYCVSLGRRAGLVQRVMPDGSPSGWVLGGRLGAIAKELICRATLWAFALERKFRSRYLEPTPPRLQAGVPEGEAS